MNTPCVMGVINCSPNSFYAPSTSLKSALNLAQQMVEEGASILDIGGEATNPLVDITKETPSVKDELKRVLPVVQAIKSQFPDILLSIDTSTPAVMQKAVEEGADIINDQRALKRKGALEMAVTLGVPVCLMHLPQHTRQRARPTPQQLLKQIKSDLLSRAKCCHAAGLKRNQIILDPGFGQGHYAKNTYENFYLLKHLVSLHELGYPLLVGWSRKSMLGEILDHAPASQRLYASIAAAVLAALNGASIIRAHDVKATYDAMKVVQYYERCVAP